MPAVDLDAASGTPLHPAAREALLAALDDGWSDPARVHGAGRRARRLLDGAREAVAAALGARADEVSFTGGGTAAAYLGVLGAAAPRGRTVLHTAVEAVPVLQAAQRLDPVSLPVDSLGRVLPFDVDPATALVCVQSANAEVGTVQPVQDVAGWCGAVPLLVDASASAGRSAVPEGWSVLVAAARQWGGPAGVGVLAVRTGTRWRSPLPDDERPDRFPGVPDVPSVVAAAVALEAAARESAEVDARLRPLVADLRVALPRAVPGCLVVGDPDDRLPHLVTACVEGVDDESLVRALDERGVRVASGSSCTASSVEPSHVLAAMGAPTDGGLRVSLHRTSTYDDVARLLEVLPGAVAALRSEAP